MANPKVSGSGFEWLKRQGFDESIVYDGKRKTAISEDCYKVGKPEIISEESRSEMDLDDNVEKVADPVLKR